jgi:hypothetical protein
MEMDGTEFKLWLDIFVRQDFCFLGDFPWKLEGA